MNNLINSKVLDKFLVENTIEDLSKFAQDFWENPSQSVKSLKDKYGIRIEIYRYF